MDPRTIELYDLRILNNYLCLTIDGLAAARRRAFAGNDQSYAVVYPFSLPPIPPAAPSPFVARPWWGTIGRR